MELPQSLSFNLNSSYLFASIFWSGIGGGYWVYAKRQRSVPALICGIGLIAVSFAITSWILMSLASIAIMVGTYFWMRADNNRDPY
jgi:hypothetical protein